MLEASILDDIERLLAAAGLRDQVACTSDYIQSSSPAICLGRDSYSLAYPFTSYRAMCLNSGGYTAASWVSNLNNVLVLCDVTNFITYAISLLTGIVTTDQSGANFSTISEDASGVIWAVAVNSGQYGIWKRNGAGSWTKVLSDTNVGHLCLHPNGTLYYISYSGNWYILANGTATVSSNPHAWSWHLGGYDGTRTNDSVQSAGLYGSYITQGNIPAVPDYFSASAEAYSGRYWPANANGQSSGTKVMPYANIPYEHQCELFNPNYLNNSGDAGGYQPNLFFRLDATYMLHVSHVQVYNAAGSRMNAQGTRKIVMSILNKVTGVAKYVGSFFMNGSCVWSAGASASANLMAQVVAARMVSGVLTLWWCQATYQTNVSTDIFGLYQKSFTLNLDF